MKKPEPRSSFTKLDFPASGRPNPLDLPESGRPNPLDLPESGHPNPWDFAVSGQPKPRDSSVGGPLNPRDSSVREHANLRASIVRGRRKARPWTHRAALGLLILTAVSGGVIWLRLQLAIERCIDAGGKWASLDRRCTFVEPETPPPLLARPGAAFKSAQ